MRKVIFTLFLVLTLVSGFSLTAFASSGVVPPELDKTQYDSYIIYYEGETMMTCVLYMSSDWDFVIDSNSKLQWTKLKDTAQIRYYKSVQVSSYDSSNPNNGWNSLSQYNGTTANVNAAKGTNGFILCSEDVYDTDGKLVFRGAPLEKVIKEALVERFQALDGQILILVVCGVGCLASLILLGLFGKVLPHYLS